MPEIIQLSIGDFTDINRIEALQSGRPFYKELPFAPNEYNGYYSKELPDGSIFLVKITTFQDQFGKSCFTEEIIKELKNPD
ncbi:MAG: hypothetical protein ACK5NK_13515 [Niabella sp.]